MKRILVWGVKGLKVLVLFWILFPLFFGFEPLEKEIAGHSLLFWGFLFNMGLLAVSMVLYRIFVGSPVLTEEEKKVLEKRRKDFADPSDPSNIQFYINLGDI